MKRVLVGCAAAAVLWAASWCPAAEDKGGRETVGVVKQGANGDLKILTKEVPAADPARSSKAGRDVATDTSPRKARIIVVPAVYAQEARSRGQRELNEKFGIADDSTLENPNYTAFLVDALVNCRKFDVLEREDLAAIRKELDLGDSDYADAAKVTKLGKVLNADYVVLPQIMFREFKSSEPVPYVGNAGERMEGRIDVWLRTADVATSRLVSSGHFSSTLKRSRKSKESNDAWVARIRGELYKLSALEGVAKIIDMAYPIKVLSVDGDTCILNRGEGALVADEELAVCKPGEMLTDPDTKETLGSQDTVIGKLKVVDVKDKTSTARIVEGAGKIEKLFVCRRTAKPGVTEAPAPKLD